MMMLLQRALIFLVAPVLISGCAAQGDFPSLAPRPYELSAKAPATDPAPPAPIASDPALLRRVADLVDKARAGASAFNMALGQARPIIAASDGVQASERWIAAQMALSRVESTRAPVEAALSEIDDERRILLTPNGSSDRDSLNAAMAEVEAINASQAASLRTLLRQVNRR